MGNKWSKSYNCTGSLPTHILGRGTSRWSTAVYLSGRDEARSLGRPRCIVCTGQSTREEKAAWIENCRDLQRSLTFNWVFWHMRSYPGPRKEPPKKIRGNNSLELTQDCKEVSVPTSHSGKSYYLQASGENTQKLFVSTVGQNFS